MDIQDTFDNAAKYLPGIGQKLSPDTLLYFYARYMQAHVGHCNVNKPSSLISEVNKNGQIGNY